MSKFATKKNAEPDSRLAIMEKSIKKEKKEIAKRNAKPKAVKAAKGSKSTPKVKAKDERKITLLTKENPKREGSEAFKRFALYSKNKTVADFISAGGTSEDIRYDLKAGHIKVA